MSTTKISDLPVLAIADAADEFVVVDDSAGVTKKITQANLNVLVENADDYEKGTWTPQVTTGSFLIANIADYIKIGELVYLKAGGRLADASSSNDIELTNLPFVPKRSSGSAQQVGVSHIGAAAISRFSGSANSIFVKTNTGDSLKFVAANNSATNVHIKHSDLVDDFNFIGFTLIYEVA